MNPYKEQKLVIVGSNGMLVFDDTEPIETKLILHPHTINWQNGLLVPNKAEIVPIDINDIWEEPLEAECKAFLAAIETGTKPLTSGEEGLRVLRILERRQQSLEEKESALHGQSPKTLGVALLIPDVFVHPTAIVDEEVEIGKGTKI